jgi:4-carboxymuconolactone decarboxylase
VPIAFPIGATQEQVDAIERNELDADAFDDVQRNVLRFTDEVIHDARASHPTFEALRTELSPREVVELLMVIGQYMMLARVMATVDIELAERAGRPVLDRASREG